jgi:aldehyde:ferredoxin oxidoreductase
MNLYTGSVLHVDLTAGTTTKMPLRQDWLREYWGGWGLAARYFQEYSAPGTDPLSPDNPVIIMTGPLCGTLVPLSARFCLMSKSPHTGTVFESNAGGAFGPELKFAGFDGMVITGRSKQPVYLLIQNGRAELRDASAFWGLGIFETEERLQNLTGGAKTLSIGPAGENLVSFSCIGTEAYRQLGRGGTGALFGSKNLKAVACRGTGAVRVADMKAFLSVMTQAKTESLLTADNLWASSDGTPVLVDLTNEMGIHPTRNFTYGVNTEKSGLDSEAMKAVRAGERACWSCPMACGKFTRLDGVEIEGPEYETLCIAGSNCGVNDLAGIARFNRLCDDLGLDTISTGATIGLAMDMAEQGLRDFGLRFGEVPEYLVVVEEMARLSTPRGRDLALGVKRLAAKYAAEDLAVESKGMEFPAYEPRGNHGMGLAYATSERGACHLRAFTIFAEDPFDHRDLAQAVVSAQNLNAIKWAMCICDFWGTVTTDYLARQLSTGLGEEVTAEELDRAGERIWNLLRLLNAREGFTAGDDSLPRKILTQALRGGPHEGRTLTPDDLAGMKSLYYAARGWDDNAVPAASKLAALGLMPMNATEVHNA